MSKRFVISKRVIEIIVANAIFSVLYNKDSIFGNNEVKDEWTKRMSKWRRP